MIRELLGLIGSIAVTLGAGVFFGGLVYQALGLGRRPATIGAALILFGAALIMSSI